MATVIAGLTTSAAPPTMSGKVKKNGLVDAAGQGHQQGRHGDRDRALDDELGRAEGRRRQQVVDDEQEQAGQREQDQDRGLVVRPQAGDADDDASSPG